MAATTKTLTPTNQTISIPAFTDKPDNRLQTDSTGKLADAVNALSEQIASIVTLVKNGAECKTIQGKYVADSKSQFVLTKQTLVIIQAKVNNAWPRGIGFASSVSDDISEEEVGSMRTIDINNSPLTTIGIINAGTYYVACKGSSSHESGCRISVITIEI